MADAPRLLEIRSGRGDPASISLKQGTVLDPTSIGSGGMWRIEGSGVLDVHGYVYFDGKALYVQSADEKSPLSVNKHRVATAWTEVRAPSSITFGEAEIIYRDEAPPAYDDGDSTLAQPLAPVPPPKPQPQFVPGSGLFANRADDDESTRFAPIEGLPGAPGAGSMGQGTPAAAFPPSNMSGEPTPAMMMMPGHGGMPMQGMPMQPGMMPPGMQGMPPGMMQPGMLPPGMQGLPPGMQGLPPGMQGMPMAGTSGMHPAMQGNTSPGHTGQTDPGAGKKGWEKFKAEWEALPPIRRALYIMAPFTFAAACFILFDEPPPPQPVKTAPSTSASAPIGSAPPITSGAPSGAVVVGMPDSGAMMAMSDAGAVDAGGSTAVVATTNDTPKTPDKGATSDKGSDAGNNGAPPAAPAKRTTERMAADAWAEGNLDKAAQLYDQLASENPQNPAYREAARILREKLDGGAR